MSRDEPGFIGPIPATLLRNVLLRGAFLLVCIACIALVYWSLFVRLQPRRQVLQQKELAATHLVDELDQLRLKASVAAPEGIKADYEKAEALLFKNPEQLRTWQNQLRRAAPPLALDSKVKLDPPQVYPGLERRLTLVQASVDINATPTILDTNSVYRRLLKYSQSAVSTEKRINLIELSVQGDSNSVRHASAVLQLFTAPSALK